MKVEFTIEDYRAIIEAMNAVDFDSGEWDKLRALAKKVLNAGILQGDRRMAIQAADKLDNLHESLEYMIEQPDMDSEVEYLRSEINTLEGVLIAGGFTDFGELYL